MPIVNFLARGRRQEGHVHPPAYVCEDPRLWPGQKRAHRPANEDDHWDVVERDPISQALQACEGVVRLRLTKCVDGVHSVSMLQAKLDETLALAYHSPLLVVLIDHRVLKATGDECHRLPTRHEVSEPLRVPGFDCTVLAAVSSTQHLERRILVPKARVDQPIDPSGPAHKFGVECPIDGPPCRQAAMRMEGEKAPPMPQSGRGDNTELSLLVVVLGPAHEKRNQARLLCEVAGTACPRERRHHACGCKSPRPFLWCCRRQRGHRGTYQIAP
mmetsp:Transcript_19332/g.58101  ORF Transcript_19332/g.58101 Transcript_19332/m.58101 type:complete len:272 (+) Transcript_19332:147-962(+)